MFPKLELKLYIMEKDKGYCQKRHTIMTFNELLAFIKVSEYYKYEKYRIT